MRILHINNIVCHHQLPLACELSRLVGPNNFRFASTQPEMIERKDMGWKYEYEESWILRPYQCDKDKNEYYDWLQNADAIICGERLYGDMLRRVRNSKLVFYQSERWWKPPFGRLRILSPMYFTRHIMPLWKLSRSRLFNYLPMGPYAAHDIRTITDCGMSIRNWGYFTEGSNNGLVEKSCNIMWAGRMLGWKQVDVLVKAFAEISPKYKDAKLVLIGDGPRKEHIINIVKHTGIKDQICITGFMPVEDIRSKMKQNLIYVLPSNYYEGWGAVVNEAMSEGCVVVASEAAGAAKAIIDDGTNGFLFRNGDWKQLARILEKILSDQKMSRKISSYAKRTMMDEWSPEVAATRFVELCSALLAGEDAPVYTSGPLAQTW